MAFYAYFQDITVLSPKTAQSSSLTGHFKLKIRIQLTLAF
jgi:hypothetical protein